MFQMECFRCLYSEAQKDIIKRVDNILIKKEVAMVDKLISCWLELESLFYGVYSTEEGVNRNEHLQKRVNEIRYFIGYIFIRTVKFLESKQFRTFAEQVMCNRNDDIFGKGYFDFKYWAFKDDDDEGLDWDVVFWDNEIEISQLVIEKIKRFYDVKRDRFKVTMLCCLMNDV